MKIIDLSRDERLNGLCATISCSYEWYFSATHDAERNLKIQRGIIKDSKAYRTLRADLKRGCVLPPLVLAVSNVSVTSDSTVEAIANPAKRQVVMDEIEQSLSTPRPAETYIIDGLQRTNALRQTRDDLREDAVALAQFLARPLRVEVWLNMPFGAVAYRMLLLNAGQKPLSIKHQVEVLSTKLGDDLATIPGIEIKHALNSERRTQAGQFTLSKLAEAFQAWLQGTPNIDVRNSVMEQLLAESAIDTLGTSLSGTSTHDDYKALVSWFVAMDHLVWSENQQFFGNETVLLGIAAAVGFAQRNDSVRDRMQRALERLKDTAAQGDNTVLAITRFNELRQGVEVKKVNIGQYTRDMVFRAFQEYFIADGLKPMEDCWAFGATSSVQGNRD